MTTTLPSHESIALGGLLQLLGRLLAEELNPELIGILQQPEICEVISQSDRSCTDYVMQNWDHDAFENAAADYCSLFILPKGVSPMAAAWHDKGSPSEQVSVQIQSAAKAITEQFDLTVPPSLASLPSEHLGLLFHIGGQLAAASDPEVRQQALPFLQATTASWAPKFGEGLAQQQTSSFYQSLGRLIVDTVHTILQNNQQ